MATTQVQRGMKSKFNGTCQLCEQGIEKGDTIVRVLHTYTDKRGQARNHAWVHSACGERKVENPGHDIQGHGAHSDGVNDGVNGHDGETYGGEAPESRQGESQGQQGDGQQGPEGDANGQGGSGDARDQQQGEGSQGEQQESEGGNGEAGNEAEGQPGAPPNGDQKGQDTEGQQQEDQQQDDSQQQGMAKELAEAIRELVDEQLASAEISVPDEEIAKLVKQVIEQDLHQPEIEIKDISGELSKKVEGKMPPQFQRMVRLANARKHILLIGPAGCGKTYLAAKVAEAVKTAEGDAIGVPFASISCSAGMSEGHLLGRLLPTGEGGKFEYHRSEFVRCYEDGGVFLLDEMDAADENVLLVANQALSNGHLPVPNRTGNPVAYRHPDFVCVAAANTYGTGADRQYVGRNQLDEATLDRFRLGQIEMDYDEGVEKALCPDPDLRGLLQGYRTKARNARLRRVISTRFMRDAYEILAAGDTIDDIETALFAGWSPDELRKVGADHKVK